MRWLTAPLQAHERVFVCVVVYKIVCVCVCVCWSRLKTQSHTVSDFKLHLSYLYFSWIVNIITNIKAVTPAAPLSYQTSLKWSFKRLKGISGESIGALIWFVFLYLNQGISSYDEGRNESLSFVHINMWCATESQVQLFALIHNLLARPPSLCTFLWTSITTCVESQSQ